MSIFIANSNLEYKYDPVLRQDYAPVRNSLSMVTIKLIGEINSQANIDEHVFNFPRHRFPNGILKKPAICSSEFRQILSDLSALYTKLIKAAILIEER